MEKTQRLIVTETHRALSDKVKDALGLKCLSCTFLPDFSHGVKISVKSIAEDTHIRISNPSVVKYDSVSNYEFQKDIEKRYNKNLVAVIQDIHDGESEIFLAQDNDYGGNLMASLLYYHLLATGIPKRLIKRVAGIEEAERNNRPYANIYFGDFMREETLTRVVERARIERGIIYATRSISQPLSKGIRNLVALDTVLKKSIYDTYIPKESNGISLATYLTKWCLDEKE